MKAMVVVPDHPDDAVRTDLLLDHAAVRVVAIAKLVQNDDAVVRDGSRPRLNANPVVGGIEVEPLVVEAPEAVSSVVGVSQPSATFLGHDEAPRGIVVEATVDLR